MRAINTIVSRALARCTAEMNKYQFHDLISFVGYSLKVGQTNSGPIRNDKHYSTLA